MDMADERGIVINLDYVIACVEFWNFEWSTTQIKLDFDLLIIALNY